MVKTSVRRPPGNDLDLGYLGGRKAKIRLSRTQRDKHLYICGGTGTGKSRLLKNLIRQDIRNWSKNKCGLLVIDPHGNLYDNLINWLAWNKFERLPIISIDLRQDDWVVSYNLLRQRKQADPAVVIGNITEAMAYVWGRREPTRHRFSSNGRSMGIRAGSACADLRRIRRAMKQLGRDE